MSDRLTDAELASLRQHLREERERSHRVPTLTWAEVDALLDEVREARSIARDSDVRQLLDSDGAINVTAVSWWSREAPQLPLGAVSRCITKLEAERDDYRARLGRVAGRLMNADIDLAEARDRLAELETENREMRQAIEERAARRRPMSDKLDQKEIANEMRRAAQLAREHGHPEIAAGNNQIAEYIEGLECAIAAERKLSARRTAERDEARQRIAELERNIEAALDLCPHAIRVREGGGPENLGASLAVTFSAMQQRIEEREADMHVRIRQEYDSTVADAWRAEVARKDQRIAELKAERDARESQLAEMRRELMEDEEAGGAYYSSIEPILDRHAIPTTPPEAEEDDA